MPYYHIYIRYVNRKGVEKTLFSFDLSKEGVQKRVSRILKNKPFLFVGRLVKPSDVLILHIFKSEKETDDITLPSGKNVMDEKDCTIISNRFIEGRVKGIRGCTYDFLPSLPERKAMIDIPTRLREKEKVFIAHGRDEKQALRLQKYLTKKLKIDAEMFEDFKEESSGNTIIEQLEYIRDNVRYAFVIVTPDDLGCLQGDIEKCRTKFLIGKETIKVQTVCDILDKLNTRARQNVVFEHGLFMGAIGRDRVCCLLQKDTKEKPSDTDGILYVGFNKSVKETFPEITEKLRKASLIT